MRDSLGGANTMVGARTRFLNWRRWLAFGLYAAALGVCAITRGTDSLALALYRPTLPLSAIGYGPGPGIVGWLAIVAGALLNGFVAFAIGMILDQRAVPANGAA